MAGLGGLVMFRCKMKAGRMMNVIRTTGNEAWAFLTQTEKDVEYRPSIDAIGVGYPTSAGLQRKRDRSLVGTLRSESGLIEHPRQVAGRPQCAHSMATSGPNGFASHHEQCK